MRTRLKVNLTAQEDKTLLTLRTSTTVSQRVKDRAEVIRLSHQGWYVEKIATFFEWHLQTVRETLHRWRRTRAGKDCWTSLEGVREPAGTKRTWPTWSGVWTHHAALTVNN